MSFYCIDPGPHASIAGMRDCEAVDPSLNGRQAEYDAVRFNLSARQMQDVFLSRYGIAYIAECFKTGAGFRVVSYPRATNTCYEKASILRSWDPLNVIKALYYECPGYDGLYAAVIPETGCFLSRAHFSCILGLPQEVRLARSKTLPKYMTFGTCSPFIAEEDLAVGGGCVRQIVFDSETLRAKRQENTLDDFSFGLDHRLSIQMNYYRCYRMLKALFGDVIREAKLLNLAFKERLTRKSGRIRIEYEFDSLNYRTACFINGIHGFGDVTIVNDHLDELDIPEVLVRPNGHPLKALRPDSRVERAAARRRT
jgi:hypothetical protein